MVDWNPALRVIKTLCKHTQMNQSPETDSRNPRYNQCLWGPSVIGEISLSFPVRSLETMPFHRERRAEWPWICLIHFNRIPSIRKKEKRNSDNSPFVEDRKRSQGGVRGETRGEGKRKKKTQMWVMMKTTTKILTNYITSRYCVLWWQKY